jgi:ABC-type oligopeptide transport system substrate-binding subunit
MGHKFTLWLLTFGLAVALLVSAASASPSNESKRGGTLRLMWGQAPDSVDPALANGDVGSWVLLSATCARLFTVVHDPDSGKPRVVPEVVRTYSVSNGRRTYTFELERTFRFHTGAPVTAQSYVDAFDRDANPSLNSPAVSRGFMQEIVGVDAVVQGKAKRISGVEALGRYRLRIRLKRHTGDFVARLTMPYFCPISRRTPSARIDYPPGSGPYYVADHITNRRIVLERNLFYRGGRPAYPDRIVWTIEPDRTERLRATELGRNDFVLLFNYPDTVVRDLVDAYGVDRPGGRVFRSASQRTFAFQFNPDRPAFEGAGQVALRKAINYALDRPALARAHGYLEVMRSDRLLPAALSGSPRLYPLDGADPVTARRLLSRVGQRPPTLTLYAANFPVGVASAQVFIFNMRQLGIEVKPYYFDFFTLQERLNTPGEPWDFAGAGLAAAYPDPAAALVPLLRGTRYEARINAANRVAGEAARAKAWADLETDLMRNDPPMATYAEWRPLFFVSRGFGCWRPGQQLDLGSVCKK